MKLNLEAKTDEQKSVKEYLETYATEKLANKINNGVKITKDNKELVNKKNLDGFFSFATSEAQKLVSKGAQCACVKDAVVFGWAIHYFEEDSIDKEPQKVIKEQKPIKRTTERYETISLDIEPLDEPKPIVNIETGLPLLIMKS